MIWKSNLNLWFLKYNFYKKNIFNRYNQMTDNENNFYDCQNSLIKLNKLSKDFENLDFKVTESFY
jgi:hypothetical protein